MDRFLLHARQKKLLYFLNCKHGVATGRELSSKLGVSERTVRNDISEINREMKQYNIQIESIHGKGYSILIGDRNAFHELISVGENIQTKEDRIKYLIMELIHRQEGCDIVSMEDELFVSRTTIENDIKEIRSRITENQPYIGMFRKGSRVFLENNEIKKRNILIRIYAENWDYDSRDGIVLKDDTLNGEILNEVRVIIKKYLKKYSIDLDDFGLIYMILAVSVSYSRIQEGHNLEASDREPGNNTIQSAVKEIIDSLIAIWEIPVKNAEYQWISSILNELTIMSFNYLSGDKAIKVTDKKSSVLAHDLVKEIKEEFNLDFSGDERFYNDMVIHIQALKNSLISVQTQSQYLVDELKEEYSYLGHVCHYLCERLEEICGLKLGMVDENYLLPMLVMAQKKLIRSKHPDGIRTVVVSHFNASLTYYLTERLRSLFGDKITIYGVYPVYDRERINESGAEIIITTVQMDIFTKFDIPVIIVSHLIDDGEKKEIETVIQNIENNYMYPIKPVENIVHFSQDLEITIERKCELKQVLTIIEENLRSNLYVNKDIAINWDKCNYASIGRGKLFVYYIEENIENTIMSVAHCSNRLSSKYVKDIDNVVFMIIRTVDKKYIGSLYKLVEKNI